MQSIHIDVVHFFFFFSFSFLCFFGTLPHTTHHRGMNVERGYDTRSVMGNARAAVQTGLKRENGKSDESDSTSVGSNETQWIADEVVNFLDRMNARRGLEYFSFIKPSLDKKTEPKEYLQLWSAMEIWCVNQNVTTTVVHGDCRLGNMIFVPKEGDGGGRGDVDVLPAAGGCIASEGGVTER